MNNIYHIAEDVSNASGGIRTVVMDLFKIHTDSRVITTRKEASDDDFVSFDGKGPWMYSKSFKDYLKSRPKDSIFHVHGVWMYAQFIAARVAAKHNIPIIISPHGMYEPWLWKDGTIKKKLYFKFLASSAFAKANYIHAITPDEQYNLQKLFPKTNIVCIPNAIDYQDLIPRTPEVKPYFLFLGRLHPKKGLDLLIEAFVGLNNPKFDLKIAGPESEYSRELQRQLELSGVENITFLGSVSGNQKMRLYRNAHAFIAPSFSEVVGMVNLEAAIMATPVITTHQTGLLKEWNMNGGLLINPELDELSAAIGTVSSWTQIERDNNGRQLRQFVIKNYSWEYIKPKWNKLYEELAHQSH